MLITNTSLLIPRLEVSRLGHHDYHQELLQGLVREIMLIRHTGPGAELSAAGHQRYLRNRDFIRQVRRALTVRDLILLEVYEEEQWRVEFPTVEKFAEEYAGLSDSQLYKVLDAAKVYQDFAQEGLLAQRPGGRYIEQLVKIKDSSHWIAAWAFARDACKEDGLSLSAARDAFRDYCRDRQIQFGRRAPNGSSRRLPAISKTPHPESLLNWKDQLSSDHHQELLRLVEVGVIEKVGAAFANKPPGAVILDCLLAVAESHAKGPEDEAWAGMLELLRLHEPRLHKNLMDLAITSLAASLGKAVLERCERNVAAKNDYHRKSKKACRPGIVTRV